MARRRFTSKKTAQSFASKVNGRVNDLRNIEEAKSKFTVTYTKTETRRPGNIVSDNDWAPEENRDFGYPNEYWK